MPGSCAKNRGSVVLPIPSSHPSITRSESRPTICTFWTSGNANFKKPNRRVRKRLMARVLNLELSFNPTLFYLAETSSRVSSHTCESHTLPCRLQCRLVGPPLRQSPTIDRLHSPVLANRTACTCSVSVHPFAGGYNAHFAITYPKPLTSRRYSIAINYARQVSFRQSYVPGAAIAFAKPGFQIQEQQRT